MLGEQQLLKSIDELISSYKLSDIEELIIDDIRLEQISDTVKERIESLKNLESLAFTRCQLRSLDNLPQIDNLLRISLDHNSIGGLELGKLSIYRKAISISLMDNRVERIDDLKQLQTCSSLLQLNLFKNTVQNQPNYRLKVFEWVPQLIFLDNLYQDGSEIMLDDEQRVHATTKESNNTNDGKKKGKNDDDENQRDLNDDASESDNKFGKGKRGLRKKVKK